MTDYESQASRDTLVRLVGRDAALRLLWEENHCLQALLADTEARVKDTEEQLNSTERLLVKSNGEMDRLVAAIDAEREAYNRALASREQEITDVRNLLDEMTDRHWKFVNNSGPDNGHAVAAMVSGAVADAARLFAATNNKIAMIKDFRKSTGLGLRETKMICDQIAEAVRMEAVRMEMGATD